MHIVTGLGVIANILAILVLLIGLFYNFEQPKVKAVYGYSIAGCFIPYLVLLTLIGAYGLVVNHNMYSFILFFCVISPFIIGKLVKYETLKKYTIVQIVCFVFSLVTLLLNF